jgi:Ca-activated chloride channel family protein
MPIRLLSRVCALLVLAVLGSLPGVAASATTDAPADGKLLLVLDSSGSMKERTGSTTRIAAAKKALTQVVATLPDDAQVGMRVYGATVFEGEGACQDSQNVVPVGPLDRDALSAQIRSYKPYGETPIGYALQQAAEDLGSEGQRSILLVSDGEATCDPDPCVVAQEIAKDGIDLKIDVVGLDVDRAAERQLRCVARAGHGDYTAASDAASLAAGLTQLSVRAFRPFAVTGTPVEGAETPADAPEVDDGQWLDTVGADGTVKYYRVPKQPGDTVHVSATARRVVEGELTDAIQLTLETADGDFCAQENASSIDPTGYTGLLTDGVVFRPNEDPEDACTGADELVLSLRRGLENLNFGSDIPLRVEFIVLKEPAVRDVASLPAPVESPDAYARLVKASGTATPVIGGAGFNDAPELAPGTYRDTLRDGELLVYKVPVDWGQSAAVTARLQPNAAAAERMGVIGAATRMQVYSPDREEIVNLASSVSQTNGRWSGARTETLGAYTVATRYRNREEAAGGTSAASRAGFYYFTIEMAEEDEPVQADVTFAVDVTGEVAGEPTYVENVATIEPEPSPTASDQAAPAAQATDEGAGGGTGLLVGGLVALLVALAGALGFVLHRRNSAR